MDAALGDGKKRTLQMNAQRDRALGRRCSITLAIMSRARRVSSVEEVTVVG